MSRLPARLRTELLARSPGPLLLLLCSGYGLLLALRLPWTPHWLGWLLWPGLIFVGLAGGYLLHTATADPRPEPARFDAPRIDAPRAGWPGRLLLAAALLLLLLSLWLLWQDPTGWQRPLWLWLGAVGCLLAGSFLLSPTRPASAPTPGLRERPLLLGIVLLAFFLRLFRIQQIPPALFIDETNVALDALRLLEGAPLSPFATGWYETPNGYAYFMAAVFGLLGANFLALKFISLLPAVLTIPAVYALARRLFGVPTALAGAFLLAVNRWHLTMSRWGWNEVAPPLFLALAGFLLLRGVERRRPVDFAGAGVLAGLMLYTYLSSRLALATLLLFLLLWLARGSRRQDVSPRVGLAGLFGLGLLAAGGPLLLTYALDPFIFFNRSREVSIFGEMARAGSFAPLWTNAAAYARMLFQAGDPIGRHNLPGAPQADPITGLFLLLGLGLSLFRLGDRRRQLLLLWLLVNLAGGVLSESVHAPNSYRTLNAVIAVALLAGDALWRTALHLRAGLASQMRPDAGRALAVGVLLAGLAGVAVAEVGVYFGRQAQSPQVAASFNQRETRAAGDVRAGLAAGADVYVSPGFAQFSPLRFLVWGAQAGGGPVSLDRPPFQTLAPATDLPLPATGRDALLLLEPEYWAVVDYFRGFYPGLEAATERGATGQPLYLRLRIAGAERQRLAGLAKTGPGASGSIRLPLTGVYDFAVPTGQILRVDSIEWTGPRRLMQGLYSFELAGGQGGGLSWRWPGSSGWEAIPPDVLLAIAPPQGGLLGLFYEGEGWEGGPLLARTLPFLHAAWPKDEPLPHPFSARFVGTIRVNEAGVYRFRLLADDGVGLFVGGVLQAEAVVPDQPNRLEVALPLEPGSHELRIDYFQRGGGSGLEFYWQPPGRAEFLVPPSVLAPPG